MHWSPSTCGTYFFFLTKMSYKTSIYIVKHTKIYLCDFFSVLCLPKGNEIPPVFLPLCSSRPTSQYPTPSPTASTGRSRSPSNRPRSPSTTTYRRIPGSWRRWLKYYKNNVLSLPYSLYCPIYPLGAPSFFPLLHHFSKYVFLIVFNVILHIIYQQECFFA